MAVKYKVLEWKVPYKLAGQRFATMDEAQQAVERVLREDAAAEQYDFWIVEAREDS